MDQKNKVKPSSEISIHYSNTKNIQDLFFLMFDLTTLSVIININRFNERKIISKDDIQQKLLLMKTMQRI